MGLSFALAGICVMLDPSVAGAMLPVALVFATGVTMVLSRTVNARLAAEVGDVLDRNLRERHIRGGEATRRKYSAQRT